MPYRNKEDRARWERENRPEKLERIRDAARWADQQIATLEELRGERHSREDRRLLRSALQSQYLRDRYGLGKDRPEGAEKQASAPVP